MNILRAIFAIAPLAKPLTPQQQAAKDLAADTEFRRLMNRPWAQNRARQLTGERRKRFEGVCNG